jgi:hypothetical protein
LEQEKKGEHAISFSIVTRSATTLGEPKKHDPRFPAGWKKTVYFPRNIRKPILAGNQARLFFPTRGPFFFCT